MEELPTQKGTSILVYFILLKWRDSIQLFWRSDNAKQKNTFSLLIYIFKKTKKIKIKICNWNCFCPKNLVWSVTESRKSNLVSRVSDTWVHDCIVQNFKLENLAIEIIIYIWIFEKQK